MDEQGKRIKEYVEAHGQEIIGDLVELTKAQSPTTCKELADACGQKIRELVKERVGIDGTIYPQEKRGDHMSFTLGEQKEQILMPILIPCGTKTLCLSGRRGMCSMARELMI